MDTQAIENQVFEYRAAQEALDEIAEVAEQVADEFAVEIETIQKLQECIEKRRTELLKERGITANAKKYEAAQKQARQELYNYVRTELETEDYTITPVNQKPKAERVEDWSLDFHKDDVRLLIANDMWSNIDIKADDDLVSFMRLREKNEMQGLLSVEVVQSGYCKVALK